MNNVKRRICFCLAIVATVLSGCYKEGLIRGSNELLLNGSLLKGPLANALITISDVNHLTIWQGQSNELAQFESQFSVHENSLFHIKIDLLDNTTMVCDTAECYDRNGNLIANYQEIVPASELTGLRLSHLSSSNTQRNSLQVNALTTLVYDRLVNQLQDGVNQSGVDSASLQASRLVLTALNLSEGDINLLDSTLSDVEKISDSSDQAMTTLSLVNASIAENITLITPLSSAISQFVSEPDNHQVQDTLSDLKTSVMASAVKLAQSGLVEGVPATVEESLHEAQINTIDFELLQRQSTELQMKIQAANAVASVTGATGANG
ncbi:hypothetical protein [Pseudoalteromonas obscura]|uniref:Uncharacterized protein n=1 Tax=Pseudoalteromonas obscura TaxID=3048491 RepID=A0ABT7EET3_9GAMM|nr:hypothetical protein [Pseudoalteromonas sp. P94(2023)]MDK2593785.1 hypothetical protein [Pseudoalteromonas sp. P94(2023)]